LTLALRQNINVTDIRREKKERSKAAISELEKSMYQDRVFGE
jgi:hypothetical protein